MNENVESIKKSCKFYFGDISNLKKWTSLFILGLLDCDVQHFYGKRGLWHRSSQKRVKIPLKEA